MHVDRHGPESGHPIALIHGWAMHGGIFRPLVDRLADRFRVHVVDLPGHGHSSGQWPDFDLDDCVARLTQQLPPSIWIGWSLGGLVTLRAATTSPDAVRGLGLICASPCFVAREDWAQGVDLAVLQQFGRELADDYRGTIERFLALESLGDEQAASCLRELRAQVFERGEPSVSALEAGLHTLEQVDLRAPLSRLDCPSAWIAGSRDRLVPWRAMQWAAEAAQGRFQRIDGAAHAPFLTHLAKVVTSIDGLVHEVHGA
jgi:pimeloyl-[acyl-carrier protein] methyl ester esterase